MDLSSVFGILTVVMIAISAFFFIQMRGAQTRMRKLEAKRGDEDAALAATRSELSATKEKLARKDKMLAESKEEARKKAKRQGKKEARRTGQDTSSLSAEDTKDLGELRDQAKQQKLVIASLQKQVQQVQTDAERTVHDATSVAKSEVASTLDNAKSRAEKAERELKEFRASVKKDKEARPNVPGSGLDLKALEPEVVQELARYYRSAEDFHKLFNVSQNQLQLERDKVADTERRYLAVCRELAVAASSDGVDDARAKELAESVVAQSDAAQTRRAAPNDKKKKRRRRRKRTDGESGGVEAASNGEHSRDNNTNGSKDDGAAQESKVEPVVAADAMKNDDAAQPTAES